jgi:hypothetical protein
MRSTSDSSSPVAYLRRTNSVATMVPCGSFGSPLPRKQPPRDLP